MFILVVVVIDFVYFATNRSGCCRCLSPGLSVVSTRRCLFGYLSAGIIAGATCAFVTAPPLAVRAGVLVIEFRMPGVSSSSCGGCSRVPP